ncbi:hypothetical protein AAE478_003817 [Parahypoxylon ruwenzoriense]
MPKPSIVLVPGSFSPPELYEGLVKAIAAKGYEIKALHYPSVGLKTGPREGAPPTMYDDAAFITKEVESLADDGKDGIPDTESTKGPAKGERQKLGKGGGIVRLLYMTSLVPAIGATSGSILAEVPDENRVKFGLDDNSWFYFTDIPTAAALIFSGLPNKEEAEAQTKGFLSHSAANFSSKLTHPSYKDVPMSYLFCEKNQIIPAKYQRSRIEIIERESGKKVDITSVNAGHCPQVTAPQKVIDWILLAAAKHESN